ncbi:hypothetical protein F4814DRAFT_458461 [Daldinia grandis]|nr:hypothetical protein F4814DRAFT_458461 [Daldinia grandis]
MVSDGKDVISSVKQAKINVILSASLTLSLSDPKGELQLILSLKIATLVRQGRPITTCLTGGVEGGLESGLRDKHLHVWHGSRFMGPKPEDDEFKDGSWVFGEDPQLLPWEDVTEGRDVNFEIAERAGWLYLIRAKNSSVYGAEKDITPKC